MLVQEKGRAGGTARVGETTRNSQRSREARGSTCANPQLDEANAQLLAAQAELNTARDNLERTIIRAPYDALIRQKHRPGSIRRRRHPAGRTLSVEPPKYACHPQSKLEYLELPGLEGYEAGSAIDLYTDVGGDIKHWSARLHRTEVFSMSVLVRCMPWPGSRTPTACATPVDCRCASAFVNANIGAGNSPVSWCCRAMCCGPATTSG